MFQITGVPTVNQGIGGALFKPWDQRTRSAHELQLDLQQKWAQIAGAQVFAFQFPPLPGSSGFPVQFVITTTEPFQNLNDVAQAVVAKALAAARLLFRGRRSEDSTSRRRPSRWTATRLPRWA